MNKVILKIGDDTHLEMQEDSFVEAVLTNQAALDAILEGLQEPVNNTFAKEDVLRFAMVSNIWVVVAPLIWEAYEDQNEPAEADWKKTLLPERVPLKEEETRRRRKKFVVDYEGHPKVKLALELLWHWCTWHLVAEEAAEEVFPTLYDMVKHELEQRTLRR